MKLWGSIKQQAGKAAFEAEKMVRIRREEGAISSLRAQIDAQTMALGKNVLNLMEEGALEHPALEPFVQQVAQFREEITAIEAKIALIKAEEFSGDIPPEGAEPTEPAPPPAAPTESVPPSTVEGTPPPMPDEGAPPPEARPAEDIAADKAADAPPTEE